MSFLGLEDEKRESGTSQQTAEQTGDEKAIVKQADTILFASAISILFYCLGGIIATYFAYQAKQDADAGNVMGAQHSLRIAKGWMIATYPLGILAFIGKLSEGK